MRPAFYEDNIKLLYDSAQSTNTIQKGDNVYIAYDEVPFINQSEATKYVFLNPFAVVIYEGLVTLSPASDEWRDINRIPNKIIAGGTRLSGVNAFNWNNWSWSWGGIPSENLQVGSSSNTQGGMVNRVVSEETILEQIEDRVLQTAFLPFMRSRKVSFKVQGLRPNTRVFLLMDGKNISDYARAETFVRYGNNLVDEGNTLFGLTSHPDGTNTLTTDGNGEIEGSFLVPNNNTLRFRVGDRQLKFLDISVDNEANAGCIARGTYSAKGFLDTKQATFTSTRQLNVQGFYVPPPVYYSGEDGNGPDDGTDSTDNSSGGPTGDPNGGRGGSDIGEDGGPGSTYICTATYNNGFINNKHFSNLKRYGVKLRKIDPDLMRAYDWFGPVIANLFNSKYLGVFLTKYYESKYKKSKLTLMQSIFDVASTTIMRPTYRLIGKILKMKKGN
jgi:hypothetical protein